MNFNYFDGIREIIPSTHFEVDKSTFADVSISQFWDLVYRDECSCGEEKTITYKEEIGVSQEESTSIEGELGFTIQAVLTALSSKVGVKFNRVITISKKVERTRFSKFQILKCGKHEKIVYQLVSKWHIEPYKIKKRFLRSDKRIPLDSFDRNHREDIWINSPKIRHNIPECDCNNANTYNGNITLGNNHGIYNLPYKLTQNKLEIYGIHDKLFSAGDCIKIDELTSELKESLHIEADLKILTYGLGLPILDISLLVVQFKKLVVSTKEILKKYFKQDYIKIESYFKEIVIMGTGVISNPDTALPTYLEQIQNQKEKVIISLKKL